MYQICVYNQLITVNIICLTTTKLILYLQIIRIYLKKLQLVIFRMSHNLF